MAANNNKFIEIVEGYFEEIANFGSNSEKARASSIKTYKIAEAKYEKLPEFRLMIDGLILKISKNFHTPPNELSDNISYKIGLCASFLRTHFIINNLIMSSDIIEASTLIRKQLEAFTRLNELDKKDASVLKQKTPNVNNVFNNTTKELYKQLSEIAHSGSKSVIDLISNFEENNHRAEANIYPIFSIDSLECFKFHAYVAMGFLGYFIKFAMRVYGENYKYEKDIGVFLTLVDLHSEIKFLNNKS